MAIVVQDTACILVASELSDDWYTIERAVHDGRTWMQPTTYGSKYMMSCRLVYDTSIEGTGAEMKSIAIGIKARQSVSHNRCEALIFNEGVALSSPRNSEEPYFITYTAAEMLANNILFQLIPALRILTTSPRRSQNRS